MRPSPRSSPAGAGLADPQGMLHGTFTARAFSALEIMEA